jgi:predicted nuclease with TOPRIM domain
MMDIQQRMAEYRKKLSRVFQESFLGDERKHIAFMDVNAIEIEIISEWEAMEKRVASVQRENKELYDMIADMVKDKNRLYERIEELEAEML